MRLILLACPTTWSSCGSATVPTTRRPGGSWRRSFGEVAQGTPVRDIDATDPAVAEAHHFPGSPTIRVDGRDVDPSFVDPGDYTPRCRIFWTSDGPRGVPERAWIEEALRR